MRLAFAGTPEFAIPTLKKLLRSHTVCLVITQPDRPKGRGKIVEPPPVKIEAINNHIPVTQPDTLRDGKIHNLLKAHNLDAVVVVAYGKMIPEDMLYIPRHGFINVHASLLPLYRGASPINRAIMDGHKASGVSIMLIDKGMDSGPVYLKAEIPIEDNDDAITLAKKLSILGAEKILEVLTLIGKGEIQPKPQDHAMATYAPMLKKPEGSINWDQNPIIINNMIRGLVPWPCVLVHVNAIPLKIWKASYTIQEHELKPGTLIKEKGGIKIACRGGYIVLEKVQPAGKKIMDALAFAQGLREILLR